MKNEDICLWPCGTWCHASELEEFLTFMSDDYEVIGFEDPLQLGLDPEQFE